MQGQPGSFWAPYIGPRRWKYCKPFMEVTITKSFHLTGRGLRFWCKGSQAWQGLTTIYHHLHVPWKGGDMFNSYKCCLWVKQASATLWFEVSRQKHLLWWPDSAHRLPTGHPWFNVRKASARPDLFLVEPDQVKKKFLHCCPSIYIGLNLWTQLGCKTG